MGRLTVEITWIARWTTTHEVEDANASMPRLVAEMAGKPVPPLAPKRLHSWRVVPVFPDGAEYVGEFGGRRWATDGAVILRDDSVMPSELFNDAWMPIAPLAADIRAGLAAPLAGAPLAGTWFRGPLAPVLRQGRVVHSPGWPQRRAHAVLNAAGEVVAVVAPLARMDLGAVDHHGEPAAAEVTCG